MIASLRGTVVERLSNQVIIEAGGVGYGVLMTTAEGAALATGQVAKVYIYEHIKEDTHDLFGFCSLDSKRLFEQLLSVKNVGPKVALSVLDIGSSDIVRAAIAGGDVKSLQAAKGVGKRAAEQIVVELRDKVGIAVGGAAENVVERGGINAQDEAVQALVALGYSDVDAQSALANIDSRLPTEQRIRRALQIKH